MAAIAAVLGGSLGFFLALLGIFFFHVTLFQALGLWTGTGLALITLAAVAPLFARRPGLVRA